ncbi:MAG TPA: S41 family peptidase [Candidatus Acidoferrales bacterium]
MRRSQIVRTAFLLGLFVVFPNLAERSRAQQKMNSVDVGEVRGMLRDAFDAVKKYYYDPTYHGADLEARYHQCDERIKNAPSINEGMRMVAAFLDGLNDSHTFFIAPQRAYRFDYGYRYQLFGDQAFITRVRPGTDAESKVHPGDRLVALDSYAVNRQDLQQLRYYLGELSPQPVTELVLVDPNGAARKISVNFKIQPGKKVMDITGTAGASDIWQLVREEQNQDHVVRQRTVTIGDVMIWKMPEFFLEDLAIDHYFEAARKCKALILDLRSDPGGSTVTLERMVGNVFDHDVQISNRVGKKEMKPQLAKTVGDHAFGGKLIVLVDSQSASAAELFARVIQLEKRGTVLGDRSSGSVMEARRYPYEQGFDTKIFYTFSITDADLVMSDDKSLEHAGVTPDEIVLPTAQDLAGGRDPVLARAAELAGIQLDPVEAGKLFPFEWVAF